MIAGIFIGLGIAAILWFSWYLSPLGDPETGAGRQESREGNPNPTAPQHFVVGGGDGARFGWCGSPVVGSISDPSAVAEAVQMDESKP